MRCTCHRCQKTRDTELRGRNHKGLHVFLCQECWTCDRCKKPTDDLIECRPAASEGEQSGGSKWLCYPCASKGET